MRRGYVRNIVFGIVLQGCFIVTIQSKNVENVSCFRIPPFRKPPFRKIIILLLKRRRLFKEYCFDVAFE